MAGGREEGRTLVREEGGRVVTWQQIYICVLCTVYMCDVLWLSRLGEFK